MVCKNITKVVSATSSEGILVSFLSASWQDYLMKLRMSGNIW